MNNEIVKKYENDDLIVNWRPHLCIHAKECVKSLPKVYNPNERPWIKIENASTEELIAQINKCPSGALSYDSKNMTTNESISKTEVEINALPNGPLIIKGSHKINGKQTDQSALCRCGASQNKPFCDGSHAKIDFVG